MPGRMTNDLGGDAKYAFLVSGSQSARICHAPTNLPSTSSILGHLGSTGNYNIGLLNEEFEVAARKWAGSWHANPEPKLLAQPDGGAPPAWREHVPPVASDQSLEPWICLNLDNADLVSA